MRSSGVDSIRDQAAWKLEYVHFRSYSAAESDSAEAFRQRDLSVLAELVKNGFDRSSAANYYRRSLSAPTTDRPPTDHRPTTDRPKD